MRITLLGVSHWHAQMHADAASDVGLEIASVWDWNASRAAEFARTNRVWATESLESCLADGPDLCVVMGHPDLVPALAEVVLAAGLPMILEKPAVSATFELERLLQSAERRSAFVAVPFPHRLGPAMQEYYRLQHGSRSGVAHAHFRIVNGSPQRYRNDGVEWMLEPAKAGGGALRNLGIHAVDCALSLASSPLSIAYSHVARRIHRNEEVEDHALVAMTDSEGALFTIEAGYTYASTAPGGDFEWRIATPEAYLIDRGEKAQAAVIEASAHYDLKPLPLSDRYRAFMADTVQCLSERRPPTVSIGDYVAAMRLIDRAYEVAGPC